MWEARYVRLLMAIDAAAIVIATLVAYGVRFQGANYARPYLLLSVVIPAAWVGALALSRAYDSRMLFVGMEEYQRVLRTGIQVTVGIALTSYILDARLARGYMVIAFLLATALTLVGRVTMRRLLQRARRNGAYMRRVLVLGHENAVADLTSTLHRKYHHGLAVVGACLPEQRGAGEVADTGVPVVGSFAGAANAAAAVNADTVIVLPCPEMDGTALRRLAWELERDDIDLIVAGSLQDIAEDRIVLRPIEGLPLMHIEHPRFDGMWRLAKAVFDVVAAAALLVLLAPVFLVIALLIKLDTYGPVFFRQTRVGRNGEEFRIFKFRTMYVGAEYWVDKLRDQSDVDGVLFKLRQDPRVTPVGRFLRRWSLDELPQLLNVVMGQMSLVGPRPALLSEVAQYPFDMRRRLAVKPGMTGLWQISGRSDLSWDESIRLDLRYVENWSFSLDLVILLRTGAAVVRGAGAY